MVKINYNGYDDEIIQHIDEEWEITNVVGSGGFSKVFKAKKLNGTINGKAVGLFIAIKKIEKHKFEFNEINILKKLKQHNSIAKFYGLGKDESHIYIYMEYVYGISIAEKLKLNRCRFSEQEIHIIIKSLVEAIYFIHQNCIIHRDIKGENILLDKRDISVIKLIDFGLSRLYEGSSKHHSLIGTYTHMAPEVRLQTNKAGRKSDIWSLGCTIIEMAGGDLTILDEDAIPIIPSHLSIECKHFIQSCLVTNPNGRADISYLKNHKYLIDQSFKISNLKETLLIPIKSLEPIDDEIENDHDFKLPAIKERLGSNSILNIDNEVVLPALQKPKESRKSPETTSLTLPSFIHRFIPDVHSLNLSTFDQIITPRCIPSSVTSLTLPIFNQSILKNSLPSSITRLVIPSFNQFIEPESLPDSITSISLDSFNQPLAKGSLPRNLSKLVLPSFNGLLYPGYLPSGIIDLKLPKFNYHPLLERVVPVSVKRLSMASYNQILNAYCIPPKVEFLKMKSFNHPIEKFSLPDSIKELILPSFNPVGFPLTKGCIPESVYYLLLSSYNQYIEPDSFPHSIENLVDLKSFNQPLLPNCIPELVEELTLSSFNQPLVPFVFPNLKQLDLPMYNYLIDFNCLPNSLVHLSLMSFNKPILPGTFGNKIKTLLLASYNPTSSPLVKGCIPDSVETLSMRDYNQPISPNVLPSSIKILILGKFNQTLEINSIPPSVTHLVLSDFNQIITDGCIPSSVTKLYFDNFNQDLDSESIPESVTDLDLGKEFEFQSYSSNLPFNIISLKCSYKFTKPLRKRDIPSSVTKLDLPMYNLAIPPNTIPKSVVSLTLGLIADDIKSLKNIPASVINLALVLNNNIGNNNQNISCTCACGSDIGGSVNSNNNTTESLGSLGSGSSGSSASGSTICKCSCSSISSSGSSSSSNSSSSSGSSGSIGSSTEIIDTLKQNLINNIISIKVNGEEINLHH